MDVKLNSIVASLVTLASMMLIVKVLNWAWFRPKKLEKFLRKQGLRGSSYKLLIGDMGDYANVTRKEQTKILNFSDKIAPHIYPFYHNIINKYGENSYLWVGTSPRINIGDSELLKEILSKPDIYHKTPDPINETILGGIVFLEDEKWATHRRIINPAFHLEKLKKMVPEMYLSCSNMLGVWESLLSSSGKKLEIDVWPYLNDLTGDVISRTAFGSSHAEGKRIFDLQREQVGLFLQLTKLSLIPGWRYIPNKANRRMNAISREMKSLLRGIINQREMTTKRGETINDDLLGILMESNAKEIQQHGNKQMGLSIEEVMEECKVFYFAGSETTSNLLVWTMVMLSKYKDWQDRAREEVSRVFGKKEPTFDDLSQLKTVTMITYEVMRMYPPAPLTFRAPIKTVKLGSMIIPKGAELSLLIGVAHHDPKNWGDDANEFRPDRFSEGISNAATRQFSFLPFGNGPRVCVGQNFAMLEAKMAIALILERFAFELSPSYKHAPFPIMTLQPQYGAPLILHKL